MLSDVSIIKIPHKAGSLQELLNVIDKGGVSVEYMYGLSIESNEAYVVLKASSTKIEEILDNNGVKTLSCQELASL